MDVPSVFIGLTSIAYGLFTLYARFKKPEWLGKLQAMQHRFGARAGGLLHWIVYTIVPIVLGGLILNAGLQGRVVY